MRIQALISALLISCCASADTTPATVTSAWWNHVRVLASDPYQGRLTGSAGYRKAARYVADSFQRIGLRPAGSDGFFQHVEFVTQTIRTGTSTLRLATPRGIAIDVADRIVLNPNVLQRADVSAPLVFAGYGLHLPEAGYDDFSDVNLRGAIAVVLLGGPDSLTAEQRAHAFADKFGPTLERAGAAGVIVLSNPKNREVPWERQKAAGSDLGMILKDVRLRRLRAPVFAGAFDESRAQILFDGSGHSFADLVALADARRPLPHFKLLPILEAHVDLERGEASADNVVAELPGRDARLGADAIILSSHLDHLGTAAPDRGNGMFPGAMDDASGIATMLEVAKQLRVAPKKPRRSILFLAVCGEEKGMLGSRYFAAYPTRHEGHLVADINTDMFLPLYPLHDLVGFGAGESSLGDDARIVAAELGARLVPDPQPDHLIFVRSDQYSFVRKGIPALMLTMSPRSGTPEEATYKAWFTTRYHAQADDLNQPVDLAAADAFNTLVARLTRRIADAPEAPAWHATSYFAQFKDAPLP